MVNFLGKYISNWQLVFLGLKQIRLCMMALGKLWL